jgi:6-phosphogluconolactonase
MIQIFPDRESLSLAAALLFMRQAKQAARARGRFSVALSGGETPRRTYELLGGPALRRQVPWGQVHVFWGDERCVPPTDRRSNARLAREALLDHVPIPAAQVHPIRCDALLRAGAREYEARLRAFFAGRPPRFDLVLLGLGENGHTASLFPGTAALTERRRWVAEVHLAGQDLDRVTLTAPLINWAALVAFLVAGAAKAMVLREVLQGRRQPRHLPAQLIQPQRGQLLWLVDQEAAALIGGGIGHDCLTGAF